MTRARQDATDLSNGIQFSDQIISYGFCSPWPFELRVHFMSWPFERQIQTCSLRVPFILSWLACDLFFWLIRFLQTFAQSLLVSRFTHP
jgi:hypothetical protein